MSKWSSIFTLSLLLFSLQTRAQGSAVEANKKIVTDFYKMTFYDHKPKEAADAYFGDKYIQHNPNVPDGKKPFVDYFVPFFQQNPEAKNEIKKVIADGDLVVLHVHSTKNKSDRGFAIVDIFRVEKGKIVEHWDVRQEIPAKAANNNTMF